MFTHHRFADSKIVPTEKARLQTTRPNLPQLVPTNQEAISRLVSAAVVDAGFRKLLLTKPDKAMTSGYNGETFDLTEYDRAQIRSIQATSLQDFAAQLVRLRENNSSGEWVISRNQIQPVLFQLPKQSVRSWETNPLPTL